MSMKELDTFLFGKAQKNNGKGKVDFSIPDVNLSSSSNKHGNFNIPNINMDLSKGSKKSLAKDLVHWDDVFSSIGDLDGDGVPNFKDCRPLDPSYQDFPLKMQKHHEQYREPIENLLSDISTREPQVKEAMHRMDFILMDVEEAKVYPGEPTFTFGIVPKGTSPDRIKPVRESAPYLGYDDIEYGEKPGVKDIPKEEAIYRGMSWQEFQTAKKKGYFKSRGKYNLETEGANEITYGSIEPRQAVSYASSFAPWQKASLPDNPGVVVAFSKEGWEEPPIYKGTETSERVYHGPIPLKAVKAVYKHNIEEVHPGTIEIGKEYGTPTTFGRKALRSYGKWSREDFAKEKDLDEDGVPDSKDCVPYDPERQHLVPFLYHFTDEKNLPKIKREGLIPIEPGAGTRGRRTPEVEQAIAEAEEQISEEGMSHGTSNFFYNEPRQMRHRPFVVVNPNKLKGLEGSAKWTEQAPWENLVGTIFEGPPDDFSDEDWEEAKREQARYYVSTQRNYPVGDDIESSPGTPKANPDRQIFIEGNIPPKAVVAVVSKKQRRLYDYDDSYLP